MDGTTLVGGEGTNSSESESSLEEFDCGGH